MSSPAPWPPPSSLRSWRHGTGATRTSLASDAAADGLRPGYHPRRGRDGQRGGERPAARAPRGVGGPRCGTAKPAKPSGGGPRWPRCRVAVPTCSPAPWACPPTRCDATGQVLAALAATGSGSIGLGLADDRYFTFNSGMGIDAEVVRAVEGRRAHGRSVSPALYLRMAGRQFSRLTDRRRRPPALASPAGRPDRLAAGQAAPDADGRCSGARCRTPRPGPTSAAGRSAPTRRPASTRAWTCSACGSLCTARTLRTLRQMLVRAAAGPPRGRGLVARHDLAEFDAQADRPVAFQIDGEYVGERERVAFRARTACDASRCSVTTLR